MAFIMCNLGKVRDCIIIITLSVMGWAPLAWAHSLHGWNCRPLPRSMCNRCSAARWCAIHLPMQAATAPPRQACPLLRIIAGCLAQVRRGSLVFDPFVGTGSILIAAAARGALTLGADIDMRVIKFGARALMCCAVLCASSCCVRLLILDGHCSCCPRPKARLQALPMLSKLRCAVQARRTRPATPSTTGPTLLTMGCPRRWACCAPTCTGTHSGE